MSVFWGRTAESLYENPRSFIESIHPNDTARVFFNLGADKIGQPFDHEYRVVRPDGTIRWVWDRGFPIGDKTGKVTHYTGVVKDVTERKQIEAERRIADAAFNVQEGMMLTNAGSVILRVNNALPKSPATRQWKPLAKRHACSNRATTMRHFMPRCGRVSIPLARGMVKYGTGAKTAKFILHTSPSTQ